jgi:aspartate ammonia-lyase
MLRSSSYRQVSPASQRIYVELPRRWCVENTCYCIEETCQRYSLVGVGSARRLGEITLPENEPGRSVMPNKVHPRHIEAVTMLCCQITGNNVALTISAAHGNFELNVFKPIINTNFFKVFDYLVTEWRLLMRIVYVALSEILNTIAARILPSEHIWRELPWPRPQCGWVMLMNRISAGGRNQR